VLSKPEQPVLAIIGGAKVSSKLDLIGNLISKVDRLAIGGAMANTFLAAQGHEIGKKSLVEPDMFDTARNILSRAKLENCEVLLPVDVVAASEFKANATHGTFNLSTIDPMLMVLDIGPATTMMMEKALADSRTLLWNGPFGAFELEPFDKGTIEIARYAANLVKQGKLIAVAGGGDTVAALAKAGVVEDFTYVSTAGGAFLEWLEGKALPGVEILKINKARKVS
jgi:phosphoglycerate kinase